MFLSHRLRSPLPTLSGLAAAVTVALLAARPAAAQPAGPHIPPDARAFQATVLRQEYVQRQAEQRAPAVPLTAYRAPSSSKPAPIGVEVAVTVPAPAQPTPAQSPSFVVDLRGPNGEVRSFAVEGGRGAIEPRTVIVHAGESVTIRLAAAGPRK